MKPSLNKTIWSGILGILFFLIVVGVLNIIANYVSNIVFQSIVVFFNQNIWFIVLISIIMLLGSIFEIFRFPFNLPYPLFNALGGVLVVEFVFEILILISSLIGKDIYLLLLPFYSIIVILVLIVVLVVGYVHVFIGIGKSKDSEEQIKKTNEPIEWKDIGQEFKGALYNLATTIREGLRPKKSKKKKKSSKKKKKG